MKLETVDFETAVTLKELGFDWECRQHYNDAFDGNIRVQDFSTMFTYPAPELDLVCKWFRDIHEFHVEAIPAGLNKESYIYKFRLWKRNKPAVEEESGYDFFTYEKAQAEGIKQAIQYLKDGNKTRRENQIES